MPTALRSICVQLFTYFVNIFRKVLNIIVYHLYFSIFYFSFLFVLVIWPFPILNGRTVKNAKIWARLLKQVTIFLRIKWEIRNGDVLSKDRGAVIVANHQSALDCVGMFHLWETVDKMTGIGKKSTLYAGPLGVMFYFAGVVFIDRKNPKKAYDHLKVAANGIHKKIKIWIFPEGTRNLTGTTFLPFKKGAFITAIIAQAPIIPVVYSPYYFIDRKKYTINEGRMIIQCLDEIPTTGLTMDDVPDLIERVRNTMLVAYKNLCDEVIQTTPSSDYENHA